MVFNFFQLFWQKFTVTKFSEIFIQWVISCDEKFSLSIPEPHIIFGYVFVFYFFVVDHYSYTKWWPTGGLIIFLSNLSIGCRAGRAFNMFGRCTTAR